MLYTTKTDAVGQAILPALGEYEGDYDIDGIFSDAFDYDVERHGFVQVVDSDSFWNTVRDNELELYVIWDTSSDEGVAIWEVITPSTLRDGTVVDRGAFTLVEDEIKNFRDLKKSVFEAGYEIEGTAHRATSYKVSKRS